LLYRLSYLSKKKMAVEEGVAPSRLIMEINGCCCGNLYKLRKRPSGVPPYKKNTYRLILLGEPLRRASLASRRAIRSISHFSPLGFRGWFRYYPSRKKH
jgi:hypothetical protein